jgi:hypothetical protein
MTLKIRTHARLWTLLARDKPIGAIFRRGPSKQVLLIKWDTRRDSFESGQWFKGRVYERRCDLSPNGELLIYFAAKQKPPLYSWTAISKPPYFTALALWPKGDCWNGGGWFVDDKRICLNHHRTEAELHPDFGMGPVRPVKYAELRGEDDTVWGHVLERDGWKRIAEGKASRRGSHGWDLNPPQQWRKHDPKVRKLRLEMAITGLGGKNVPWYQTDYRIYAESDVVLDLGSADWADWDHRGDLVFAKGGCLFRQNFRNLKPGSAVQIADFNDRKFEEIKPTFQAQHW